MARPRSGDKGKPKNLVGGRVRSARLAHKPSLDQADLAESLAVELGIPVGQATVSRLENGERPVTDFEVVALAKILGVEAHWLLYGN